MQNAEMAEKLYTPIFFTWPPGTTVGVLNINIRGRSSIAP